MVTGGRGLARSDGRILFVEGALPGERVRAELLKEKGTWTAARTVEVLRPSPDRIIPPCPHFASCGGCDWQHIDYPAQVRFKESILLESLARIGRIPVDLMPPLTGAPFGYRWRVRFQVGKKGEVGFFRKHSRSFVRIESCPVLAEPLNAVLSRMQERPAWLGANREIFLGLGDEGAVAFFNHPLPQSVKDLLPLWDLRGCRVAGHTEAGEGFLRLSLDGVKYKVRAGSFFQANWLLNRDLVKAVADEIPGAASVVDLYAGAGNFALCLAEQGARVLAVEGDARLVSDGRRNASQNGLENLRFLRSPIAGRVADALDGRLQQVDCALIDPPRAGAHPEVLQWMIRRKIPRIHYISCDPATLARDVARLSPAYAVESARLVDFFPQTSHIEAWVQLTRA